MTDHPHSSVIPGEVAAAGAGGGPAFVCACASPILIPRRTISERDVPKEMERFDAAVLEAARALLEVQQDVECQMGNPTAAIFAAHGTILHDATFRAQIATVCFAEEANVEVSVEKVVDKITATFDRMESLQFRARAVIGRAKLTRPVTPLLRGPVGRKRLFQLNPASKCAISK